MTQSYTNEEMAAMDDYAAEMRLSGHNGTTDYYAGGWRCYNACRVCEEEAGDLCEECGAAWWESHHHGCPDHPDNNPENCPRRPLECADCPDVAGCGRVSAGHTEDAIRSRHAIMVDLCRRHGPTHRDKVGLYPGQRQWDFIFGEGRYEWIEDESQFTGPRDGDYHIFEVEGRRWKLDARDCSLTVETGGYWT